MNRLDRYLFRAVLVGGAASVLAFLLLGLIFQFIDEVDKVEGAYTLARVMAYVVLTTPAYVYDFYPVAILIGALLALGALANGSELTVMRAAGVSVARLARPVILAGLVLAVVGMVMGETLGPWGQETARTLRAEATQSALSVNTRSGLWVRDEMRFVQVGRATVGGQLLDVRLFEFDPAGRMLRTLEAARAESIDERRWQLFEVRGTGMVDGRMQAVTVDSVTETLFPRRVLEVAVVHPQHMSLPDLYHYVRHLERNDLDATAYRVALWGKALAPLSVLVMLVIAMPFAFASQRGGNAGKWLFVGMLLGVVFVTVNQIVNFMGPVFGMPVLLGALLPPLAFLAAGLYGLSRLNPAASPARTH
ncbi:MAG: LPS export ABC transporter permease LptG [Halothiobacillaceae bacterium]